MGRVIAAACVLVSCMIAADGAAAGGDPALGEKVFKRCKACHMVGEKAKNRIGPVLNGVLGRPAGSVDGYKYSKLNQAAAAEGLVWSEDTLVLYLQGPTKFLTGYLKEKGKAGLAKGRAKMPFKLPGREDAENVIAYLRQFSGKE